MKSSQFWPGLLVIGSLALPGLLPTMAALAQDSLPFDTDLGPPPAVAPEPAPEPRVSAAQVPSLSSGAINDLVGQRAQDVVMALTEQGWFVVTQTPRMVQLDRGNQGLDLDVNASTGEILSVTSVNLP